MSDYVPSPDDLNFAKCECWINKKGEIILSDPCELHSLTRKDSLRLPVPSHRFREDPENA